jgi:hypothetical protein
MLAELHRGSLVASANPSGRGSIFTLTLGQRIEPAEPAKAAGAAPAEAMKVRSAG